MAKTLTMKPFPWKCGRCRERSVVPAVVSYTTEIEHDGRSYSVTVPDLEIPRCSKCGAMVRDDVSNRRISNALRQQIGLLTPEQIRQNREALNLTQKQLARVLAIAEATLSRWETGAQIQQRAMDRLLRLFFEFPEFCAVLEDENAVRTLGQTVHGSSTLTSPAATRGEQMIVFVDSNLVTEALKLWTRELPSLLRRRWEERKEEIVDSMRPLFWWSLTAEPASIRFLRSCYEAEFPMATSKKALGTTTKRWFVAPLRATEPEDTERATLISLLAEAIDKLPQQKKVSMLEQLRHLVELMQEEPVASSRQK